jgi:hypothetical protein
VVAVGDDDRAVAVRALDAVGALNGDVPAPVTGGLHPVNLRVEPDAIAEAEVVDVVVEVLRDLPVVGVVRVIGRHGKGRVGHEVTRSVDVQRAVGRRHLVVVAVAPIAADGRALLEAREADLARVHDLAGRDTGRARADDADGGLGRSVGHASLLLVDDAQG